MKNRIIDSEKLSVVIPVYNVEQYLSRCIESILKQSYENLEIILIDDGSTDSSAVICDEYATKDARVKVIHQENAGVSVARNKGLDYCTGGYITFVDSDDWLEDIYAQLMEKVICYKADLLMYDLNDVYEKDNGEIVSIPRKTWRNIADYKVITGKEMYYLTIGHSALQCNRIYSAQAISDIRLNTELKFGEDLLFVIDAMKNIHTSVIVAKNGYNYLRARQGSVSSAKINNTYGHFLFASEKAYMSLKECGFSTIGIERVCIASLMMTKSICASDMDIADAYIKQCQTIIDSISKKDKMEYFFDNHFSLKHKIWFLLLSCSVRFVVNMRLVLSRK